MTERFIRTEKLIGKDNLEKLKNSHIAVFGIGGVGGYLLPSIHYRKWSDQARLLHHDH